MCCIFDPGEIFLENASCYRVIALHTRRSVGPLCVLPNITGETPRARTRAKVVISCSTFSNAIMTITEYQKLLDLGCSYNFNCYS